MIYQIKNFHKVVFTQTGEISTTLEFKMTWVKKPNESQLATISQGIAMLVLSCFSLAVLH